MQALLHASLTYLATLVALAGFAGRVSAPRPPTVSHSSAHDVARVRPSVAEGRKFRSNYGRAAAAACVFSVLRKRNGGRYATVMALVAQPD